MNVPYAVLVFLAVATLVHLKLESPRLTPEKREERMTWA